MMLALCKNNTAFIRARILKSFFCCCLLQQIAYAQTQAPHLIQADSSWGKEVFYFPLSFAPELAYKGFEEALFPKGWANKDSASFWSYVFAWRIKTHRPLAGADLEQNLKDYFDGLMSANTGQPKDKLPRTVSICFKTVSKGNRSDFNGKIQIFDGFTLKDTLMLYVAVEQYFCVAQATSILLFRFSPKSPEHAIWKKLNELTIRRKIIFDNKCL
jgi:hypothetical protein